MADHLIHTVVATFHQHIRLDGLQQWLRGIGVERHDPVHYLQGCKHCHAALQGIDGTARPLQAADGFVAVHCQYQAIALASCRIQIAHMASVDDVEAAIGENNPFPLGPGILNGDQ